MGFVKQQFFPSTERPEMLAEVRMPEGTSIEVTAAATEKVEAWLRKQPEAREVATFIGQGSARFFISYNPELPDPAFAKLVVWTKNAEEREALKLRLRDAVAHGLAPEALVRASEFVFGPYTPYPVSFRVMGPDVAKVRDIADQVSAVMRANPNMRQVTQDWGPRVPQIHFVLDQDRLRLIGLTPADAAQQLQFILTGITATQVREDIRTVDVVARTSGTNRLDPAKLASFTLKGVDGKRIPVSQVGRVDIRDEEPILKRRDRTPTIDVRGDISDQMQPPDVALQVAKALLVRS